MHLTEVNNRQSPWSFNHRTRAHEALDSSESSDSESQAETKSNIPSDDTKLFRQLDISSRHETVEYKPNPWSIARINAASRAPNIKEPCGPTLSEHSQRKSHPRAPQGRIVDAFKVQAERKLPRAPVPSKAFKVVKPKLNTPQVSRKDQSCIPGKSSVESGKHSQLVNASFLNMLPRRTFLVSGLGIVERTAPEVLAKDSCPVVRPLVESEPSSMPQWLISTMHNSLHAPQSQSQSEPAERGSSSVRNVFVSPESKKRPRRSPTPSPSPQRTQSPAPKCNDSRPSAPYTGPGLSAYAFDDDPDANWSTITKPTKKNGRSLKPSVARCSGPFRLPAPAVGNAKGESQGATRTEKKQGIKTKRRIITYLPPPPSQRTAGPSNILTQVGEHCGPDDSALRLGSPPGAQPPQEDCPESPALQADSDDLTLVGEVDEQVLSFDAGEVKARYPKIRRLAKETRVKLPDLLGLSSCGVVWRDDAAYGNREIKINSWPSVG
ncbi:hypothetical protein K503DRAFT_860110 [Rhizopogon vinicolor AM-OR11-026]|uniref:Uncharacterized protein n=1 Tax=Rhizopogon vinicolor AM-OR11-026 TaxID=1314800 RepID=A0A1B7MJT3_9AGAM|nr:hypothetical protein K503DRAFT_860110 [Rhizopogon vinicolor AM-OR11-026]